MIRVLPFALAVGSLAAPAAAATRDWPLRGFDRVELGAVAEVTVRAGGGFSVHAEGDPQLVDAVAATVRDGTLHIDWAGKRAWSSRDRRLDILVTMPRVAGAGVRGVGHVTVDRAEAPLTVFALDGTGSVEVGSVRSDRTVLAQSGTGSIEVAGTTGHLDARRSGVGSIDAAKLQARSAVLISSGIGSLDAQVDGPATVTQSGIGSVTVTGHPRCTVKRSGIGSVDCG